MVGGGGGVEEGVHHHQSQHRHPKGTAAEDVVSIVFCLFFLELVKFLIAASIAIVWL